MRILAVDLGTSAMKFLRMDSNARIIAIDRVPISGLDIDAWMAAIHDNVFAHRDGGQITAISVTGQMHGLLTRVINASRGIGIPWHDQRSAAMLPGLRRTIGSAAETTTGGPLATGFLAASLAWVRQHDPAHWDAITAVSVPKDALIHEMTGAHVTDPSDAVGSGLFDVQHSDWAWDVVDAFDIPHQWLPRVVASGSIAGTVTASGAERTGLPEGLPVIPAGGDAPVGAFGAGIMRDNDALIMLSTGAQLILSSRHWQPDPEGRWYTWPSVTPVDIGTSRYLKVGTLLNAGNLMAWANTSVQESLLPDRPTGLLALPHLIGTRARAGQRGAIIGLTESTTPGEIRRAFVESIGYALRRTFEVMIGDGRPPTRLTVGGGLSQSPIHRQILADVLGFPFEHVDQSEVTAYGAGLLALHTLTGLLPDDGARANSRTTPLSDHARYYDGLYPLFRELDDAVGTISERLNMVAGNQGQ